jgi:hypothetical protein
MATKRKLKEPMAVNPKIESAAIKTTNPLIFISHDSRDADLAEEFSNLLKSASAGALKSFVSSDKKGTRGIEYGLEWYPAIMDKIDEATEVVCLLTKRSVERPWILYEAGVAKGKLGKKVIGIALGIQHSVAFTGPFAQFQNNDGSVDSIAKLVLELVRKVPGLDPDQKLVEQLVQGFHKKASEIIAKIQKNPEKTTEVSNDKIVAKLFEEVKLMFENLPSVIENRVTPDSKRRRRKFHPMMLEDIMHFDMQTGDNYLGLLIIVSFFKDDFPWLYEVGAETYRGLSSTKSIAEKRRLIANFDRAYSMLGHPMLMEISGSDENFNLYKDLRNMLHRYMDNYLRIDKSNK